MAHNLPSSIPHAGNVPLVYNDKKKCYVPPSGWTKNKDKYLTGQIKDITQYGIFNYFILDIDIKKALNPNLQEILDHLQSVGIPLDTFIVKTKSGGLHLYYDNGNLSPYNVTDRQSWYKADNGAIDIRGTNTWCWGPSTVGIDNWEKGVYTIVNNIEPVSIPKEMLTLLLQTTIIKPKPTLVAFNDESRNGAYWLSRDLIDEGERDQAIFQIISHWYRIGLSAEEIHFKFIDEVIGKISAYAEFVDEGFDLDAKISYVLDREESQAEENPDGDRLRWAMVNLIYVASKDMVYNSEVRSAYPRASFKYSIYDILSYKEKDEVKEVSLTQVWIKQKDKKQVDEVGWKPPAFGEEPESIFEHNNISFANTFSSPKLEIYGNTVKDTDTDIEQYCKVLDNVFMGNKEAIDVYLSSIRWQLEHPHEPRTWSVTLIGSKGPGKGTLWHTLSRLLGNGISPDPQTLAKEFNDHMLQSKTLLFDEMDTQKATIFGGPRYSTIKTLISENEFMQTVKGKPTESFFRPAYFSVEMHANSTQGMLLEANDRRHFLVHCTNPELNKRYGDGFTKQYYDCVDNKPEFLAKLRRWILDKPYTPNFDAHKLYKTIWYNDLCNASKSAIASDIIDALSESHLLAESDVHTPSTLAFLLMATKNYVNLQPGKLKRPLNELVSDGTFKQFTKRVRTKNLIEFDGYATIARSGKHGDIKPIVVRNLDRYTTAEEARDAYFAHIPLPKG